MQLLEADNDLSAMLLERCQPGYSLRSEPEHKQDKVIATLLKRLWKRSAASNDLQQFRHLSAMLEFWREDTLAQAQRWPHAGLVREGLRLWDALGKPSPTDVLLATDLHAGNVLRSEREPWLVIDPKPFIGDPPYDVVQHLHNREPRLHIDPVGMVKRLAYLCEVDKERLQLWTFARAATPGQTGPTPYGSMSPGHWLRSYGPYRKGPLGFIRIGTLMVGPSSRHSRQSSGKRLLAAALYE